MRVLAACLLAVVLFAASARADGDPASDILLGQNVFYPYSAPVSAALQRTLNAETGAAARGHFPLKVALVAAPTDLGVVPNLFNRPQAYADFLDQEISFRGKQPLLVVMPAGFGVRGLPAAATGAAASLIKPSGVHGDDLARAAIAAVPKLAATAGLSLGAAQSTPSAPAAHQSTALIVVLLAVGSVGAAAAIIVIRRRHAQAQGR